MLAREHRRAPASVPPSRRPVGAAPVTAAPAESSLYQSACACGGGCPACARPGEPGKKGSGPRTAPSPPSTATTPVALLEDGPELEQEADLGAESLLAGAWPVGGATPLPHRRAAPSNASVASDLREAELTTGGTSLPGAVASRLGAHFRSDFGHVRVHEGSDAALANRRLRAEAFAFGEHVWLGQGRSANDVPLMAHELVHVMQQKRAASGADESGGRRIQRLRESDGELHIVEIVAFEGSLRNAQAKLSDGDLQPLHLTKSDLPAGDYAFDLPPGGGSEYLVSGGTAAGKLYWLPASVISGKLKPSEHVTVHVLPGNPQDLYERRRELHAADEEKGTVPFAQFLTGKHAKSGTYADLKGMLDAEETLHKAGVSEDEMLLIEQQRDENERTGFRPATEVGASEWATDFVGKREEQLATELKATVSNRQSLTAQMAKIEASGHGFANLALVVRELNAGHRTETWDTVTKHLTRNGVDVDAFFAAFEFEMRMATKALLTQGRVALIRMEKAYFAGDNVGTEDRRLTLAIQMKNDAESVRNAAANKLEAARKRDLAEVKKGNYKNENTTDALKQDLKDADKALEAQKSESPLGIAQERGLELYANSPKELALSKAKLRDFMYHTGETLKRGEALLQGKSETLYRADRIVALTKQLVGIRKDSLVDAVIDFHTTIVTEEPLWREVLNVVSLLAMFAPGPLGLALRGGLALANLHLAMDDYAQQSTMHDAGFASAAPGKLGLVLTAGGALLDLGSVVGAVAKSGGRIGNLGRILRGGEKTADEALAAGKQAAGSTAGEAAEDAAKGESQAGREAADESQGAAKQTAEEPPPQDTGPDPRGGRAGDGREIRGAGDDVAADAVVPMAPRTPQASIPTRAALAARRAELSATEAALVKERTEIVKDLATRRSSIGSADKVIDLAARTKTPGAKLAANAEAAEARVLKLEKDVTKLEEKLAQADADLASVGRETREVQEAMDRAHGLGKLRIEAEPVKLRTAKGVEVDSWSKDYLLGTEREAFRRDVQKILLSEPDGPLSKALLKAGKKLYPGSIPKGMKLKDFLDRPEVWQAAHVVTRGHDAEVVIVSSLFRNQRMGAELERTGVVATERAFIIQGIAVDTATAYSLVEQKLLDAAVLQSSNVRLIQLVE